MILSLSSVGTNVDDEMPLLSGYTSINGVTTVLPPPDGYQVDFEHPQRQYETEMYSVAAVGNLLMFSSLCQRLYTKIFLAKGLQLDDGMGPILVLAFMYL